MRSMFLFVSLALLFTAGCDTGGVTPAPDDSGGTEQDDASTGSDPDPVVAMNALGDECTADADCPQTPAHFCVFLQSGAPDLGYCSPVCEADIDCAADYTGPESSELSCFLPSGDPGCTILCDSNADCPGGLECKITGGPVNVCATVAD